MSIDKKLLSAQVKAIGEHYVLARLISLNYIVGLSPENTKNVDLIAISENGKKHLQIQVKTRTIGRASDNGWHMQQKHEKIVNDDLFYVFVAIYSQWTDQNQPITYVIPSKKVASILIKSHIDWHSTPGAKGQQRKDTKLRRIMPCYKDSPSISQDWMEEYSDNWEILK
jgi:hypothetical protein